MLNEMKKVAVISSILVLLCLTLNGQWQQTSLNQGIINCLLASGSNVYAGKTDSFYSSGYLFKSNNNGETWSQLFSSLCYISSLTQSDTNIYMGTNGCGIYSSNDNGITWSSIPSAPLNVLSLAADGSNIYAGTDGDGLVFSLDMGSSWNPANVNMYTVLSLLINGINVYSGTHLVGLFLSDNNGATWNSIGLTDKDITCMAANETYLFAGTGDTIFRSDDLGVSWFPVLGFSDYYYQNSLAINGSNVFAGIEGNGFSVSQDFGMNWVSANEGLTTMNVLSIALTDSLVFIGTDNGVWKRPIDELLVGIDKRIVHDPLVTIFPNPVINSPEIRFNFRSKFETGELYLYDSFGRQIMHLRNISGNYLFIKNSHLSRGTLFYKFVQDNRIIGVGKIVIE